MSGSISYSVSVDRDNSTLDLQIDYTLDPYNDPETGEIFGDTSWTLTYREPGGAVIDSQGGYGSDSNSITSNLGLADTPAPVNFLVELTVLSQFSSDSISDQWNILTAAYAATPQLLIGGADKDIIVSGTGRDVLLGFAANDVLDAGDGDDVLDGGAGADMLTGGAGNDVMIGGDDDDIYSVDSADDIVVERSGGGTDTVYSTVSLMLAAQVENLALHGEGPLSGTGNALANRIDGNTERNLLYGLGGNDTLRGHGGDDRLFGGSGHDLLDGGSGNDRMDGASGNDVYIVDSQQDLIIEAVGGGSDTIRVSGLSRYTLRSNVENLATLDYTSFYGVGNALANRITGGISADRLEGRDGDDVISGLGGDDLLRGDAGADRLTGGEGNDQLHGGADGDLLNGGAGNDYLRGGSGLDSLAGGSGADRFAFDDGDTGATLADADHITDFRHSHGDLIDVRPIDAVAGGVENSFGFIGTAAFTGVAGQLRYAHDNGDTIVTGDTNGDAVADLMIVVEGTHVLLKADFIL